MGGASADGDILGRILRKRIRIMGTTLRARTLDYKSSLVGAFEANALPHFQSGKFKAVVDTSFPLASCPLCARAAVCARGGLLEPCLFAIVSLFVGCARAWCWLPQAQAADAHAYMEANKNVGKILLRIGAEAEAVSCAEPKP